MNDLCVVSKNMPLEVIPKSNKIELALSLERERQI